VRENFYLLLVEKVVASPNPFMKEYEGVEERWHDDNAGCPEFPMKVS
jgi:hypothetical protein